MDKIIGLYLKYCNGSTLIYTIFLMMFSIQKNTESHKQEREEFFGGGRKIVPGVFQRRKK